MAQDRESLGSYTGPLDTKRTSRNGRLMWPVVLITLGLMLLVKEFFPALGLKKSAPVLLVVVGVVLLIDSGRPPRSPEGPRI